jgi:hypothetical protein
MTAIAATTARTPIAIQAFRLTVIGFHLSFKRVVHKDYEVLPTRDWPESGAAVPRATAQATVSQGVALRQRVGHAGGLCPSNRYSAWMAPSRLSRERFISGPPP